MSDVESMDRSLSLNEHAALMWVLRVMPDSGEAELLYAQSLVATVTGGSLTMRELGVPPSCAPVACSDGPLPVRAVAYDEDGALLGEVLVWVSNGYLSAIEYAWYTDLVPRALPAPHQLRQE